MVAADSVLVVVWVFRLLLRRQTLEKRRDKLGEASTPAKQQLQQSDENTPLARRLWECDIVGRKCKQQERELMKSTNDRSEK